jgi:uncharacterized Zn-binding protein involved in type VI secretion
VQGLVQRIKINVDSTNEVEDKGVPNVHRNGDVNTGGGAVVVSNNVYVNGKSISIDGSTVTPHTGPHTGAKTANGNTSVRANGTPINRSGDADTCLHTRSGGSSNVFTG